MNRSDAREKTFLLIYQYKFQPDEMQTILKDFFEENNAGGQREYIESTVLGVVEKIDEIDAILSEYSTGRSYDRVSSVCLALLRLGAYEIIFNDDVPAPVAINEAVRLAKDYDGDECVAFMNGVLGNIKDSRKAGKDD